MITNIMITTPPDTPDLPHHGKRARATFSWPRTSQVVDADQQASTGRTWSVRVAPVAALSCYSGPGPKRCPLRDWLSEHESTPRRPTLVQTPPQGAGLRYQKLSNTGSSQLYRTCHPRRGHARRPRCHPEVHGRSPQAHPRSVRGRRKPTSIGQLAAGPSVAGRYVLPPMPRSPVAASCPAWSARSRTPISAGFPACQ